jgi:hypothetical protein
VLAVHFDLLRRQERSRIVVSRSTFIDPSRNLHAKTHGTFTRFDGFIIGAVALRNARIQLSDNVALLYADMPCHDLFFLNLASNAA